MLLVFAQREVVLFDYASELKFSAENNVKYKVRAQFCVEVPRGGSSVPTGYYVDRFLH